MKNLDIVPYKWELIFLLSLSFFFNQADRQIFNVLLPDIRESMSLTDSNMGLVSSILTLIYGILVPIAGILGDHYEKKFIIILSLLLWSSGTLLTGTSVTLLHLILLRSIATGGGEAFYAPSASSLISEYHKATIATALSIHQAASYLGVVLGSWLAGYFGELYGWRATFHLFGGFGILLAIVFYFRIKTSPNKNLKFKENRKIKESIILFFKKPTIILLTLGFSGMIFVNVGFLTWMPTFLYEEFHLTLGKAGLFSTLFHFTAAFMGVIVGAKVSDRLASRFVGVRGLVQAAGLLIATPFIFAIGNTNSLTIIYFSLTLFGLFRGIYDSNIFAALYDVVEIPFRSTATGLMLMFGFVVGSISPYVLALIKSNWGLSLGFILFSIIYFVSAILILLAVAFFYKNDKV